MCTVLRQVSSLMTAQIERDSAKHKGLQMIWKILNNLLQMWSVGIGESPVGGQCYQQYCGSELHLLEQRGHLHYLPSHTHITHQPPKPTPSPSFSHHCSLLVIPREAHVSASLPQHCPGSPGPLNPHHPSPRLHPALWHSSRRPFTQKCQN